MHHGNQAPPAIVGGNYGAIAGGFGVASLKPINANAHFD